MEKQLSALLLLATVFFSSCQNFPTVNVQTTFQQDFAVSQSGTIFNEAKLIDATDDAEFEKYKHKINSIDIERVTYTFTSFNGPTNQILQTGTLNVSNEDGSNPTTVVSFDNLDLNAALGQETDLQTTAAGLIRLQDLLRDDPYKAVLSYSGKVNQGPVNLKITLKFYSKLKARIVGTN